MTYGFIIAAGNQTRFNSDIPKALSKIGNTTCLDVNIKNMSSVCNDVFVVCSEDKVEYFKDYNILPISSGLGCGDAVLKALRKVNKENNNRCFIQWGDSISDIEVYKNLKKSLNKWSDIVVACRYEDDPYVRIDIDNDIINSVEFSKFSEVSSSGFHDLSIFYGRTNMILKYCEDFYNRFFNGKYYEHKHGNEFNFLDIFNNTNIAGSISVMNNKSYSFNTEEEYKNMINEIGDLYGSN